RLIREQLKVRRETSPDPPTNPRPGAQDSDAANLITSSTWQLTSFNLTHTYTRTPEFVGPQLGVEPPRHSSLEQGPNQHLLPGL
ncbi:Pectinesterase B, partial [Dissostichus eleginoides]